MLLGADHEISTSLRLDVPNLVLTWPVRRPPYIIRPTSLCCTNVISSFHTLRRFSYDSLITISAVSLLKTCIKPRHTSTWVLVFLRKVKQTCCHFTCAWDWTMSRTACSELPRCGSWSTVSPPCHSSYHVITVRVCGLPFSIDVCLKLLMRDSVTIWLRYTETRDPRRKSTFCAEHIRVRVSSFLSYLIYILHCC